MRKGNKKKDKKVNNDICITLKPPSHPPPNDSSCWQWWDPPSDIDLTEVIIPEANKGCDYKPCEKAVCDCDSYCCEVAWDLSCRGFHLNGNNDSSASKDNQFMNGCSASILCCEENQNAAFSNVHSLFPSISPSIALSKSPSSFVDNGKPHTSSKSPLSFVDTNEPNALSTNIQTSLPTTSLSTKTQILSGYQMGTKAGNITTVPASMPTIKNQSASHNVSLFIQTPSETMVPAIEPTSTSTSINQSTISSEAKTSEHRNNTLKRVTPIQVVGILILISTLTFFTVICTKQNHDTYDLKYLGWKNKKELSGDIGTMSLDATSA